jgi:hypothetical protein
MNFAGAVVFLRLWRKEIVTGPSLIESDSVTLIPLCVLVGLAVAATWHSTAGFEIDFAAQDE